MEIPTESRKLVRRTPEEVEELAKDWSKCKFWLKKKQRFCKLQKISEAQPWCGEHLPVNSVLASGDEKSERLRVPCPIDPTQ